MRARKLRGITTPISALAAVESDETAAGLGFVELEEERAGLVLVSIESWIWECTMLVSAWIESSAQIEETRSRCLYFAKVRESHCKALMCY
jgi:hypothetical protein